MILRSAIGTIVVIALSFGQSKMEQTRPVADSLQYPGEKHLRNLTQLTFGGDNAEAYWSFDSKKLVFQSNNPAWNVQCDQIFYTEVGRDDLKANRPVMLSTGK